MILNFTLKSKIVAIHILPGFASSGQAIYCWLTANIPLDDVSFKVETERKLFKSKTCIVFDIETKRWIGVDFSPRILEGNSIDFIKSFDDFSWYNKRKNCVRGGPAVSFWATAAITLLNEVANMYGPSFNWHKGGDS